MARINPTRSELLKLKKRIKLASRGHKLLKEKRDGLMVKFIKLIKEVNQYRETLDEQLNTAFVSLAISQSLMRSDDMDALFIMPSEPRTVTMKTEYIMSTKVPKFNLEHVEPEYDYGFYDVPSEVDVMANEFNVVLSTLIRIAETEKAIKLIAQDLETTRRRVNALEHIVIPNLKGTAKVIKMKLDEMERSNFATLGIVKGMIEEKERREKVS